MKNEHDLSEHVWAVVLAGGEGMRLRSLTREVFRDERPKQYVPLLGAESLLRQTLQRAERLIPPQRTVVVSQERHAPWLAGELGPGRHPKALLQPDNRDTAAGVLLPVYWVAAQDPEAIVVVFPSDHFVLEGSAFVGHVAEVAGFIEQNPEWIVLLGARATGRCRRFDEGRSCQPRRPLPREADGPGGRGVSGRRMALEHFRLCGPSRPAGVGRRCPPAGTAPPPERGSGLLRHAP
jgi:hypothetical protein